VTPRPHLLVIAAAVTLSACGVASDNELVASVDDAELREDELREIVGGVDLLPAAEARDRVREFVVVEALTADLEALGVDVPEVETGDFEPGLALQIRQDALISTWTALDPSVLVDDGVRDLYEAGPEKSGIACASHIVVSAEADAEAVLDELAGGADFAELAAAVSVDPSANGGGFIGCGLIESYGDVFGTDFADAVRSAELGEPTGPVESDFGWHVIRLVPTDELSANAAIPLRLETFDDRYDISIDPRYGEWNPNGIVVSVFPVG
jgi:hypothetical protein